MAPRNTRMQAAIDALTPMGFSPNTIRSQVRHLLNEVYGDQGWPFIEAEAYRVLIDHILELQEKENDNSKPAPAALLPPPPPAHALLPPPPPPPAPALLPPPPQTPNIPSQDPEIPENPTENPIPVQLQASSSPQIENILQTVDPSLGENHLQNQLQGMEAQIAAALATCDSAPPGFEGERRNVASKPKRRPYLGWIGAKDDNDFVILEPMPYEGQEESRGAHGKRKSRWDEKP